MGQGKRCTGCMAFYHPGHWAAQRRRCPACGGTLVALAGDRGPDFEYEHVDSSVMIRFDLEDLLIPAQLREVKWTLLAGVGLLLLACGARLAFVFLGGLQGFWSVPAWFEAIVMLMLLLSLLMTVWSGRRWRRHRRAVRRSAVVDRPDDRL